MLGCRPPLVTFPVAQSNHQVRCEDRPGTILGVTAMDTKQLIVSNLRQVDFIVEAYLADLTDAELLVRPVPGANHIAWQWGHLIVSESRLGQVCPGYRDPLPPDFAPRFTKETSKLDDAGAFLQKEEYQRLAKEVRAATLAALEKLPPADLDKPAAKVPPMAKT